MATETITTTNDDDNAQTAPDEAKPLGGQSTPPLPDFNAQTLNLAQFRLSGSLAEHAGAKRVITTIPVRKPSKERFFRTMADENARLPTAVIELKEEGETYLVDPQLWPELEGESTFVEKLLVPVITRQGDVFLWPIRLPGPDGVLDDWNQSALEVANEARAKWVRMFANRGVGAYEYLVAPDPQSEPEWPLDFERIVEIAFKNRIIHSVDHPVIQRLRGV